MHFMDIHCAAAEHGGLIKKKKGSSWVKLKAFRANVGQPNKVWHRVGFVPCKNYFCRDSKKR